MISYPCLHFRYLFFCKDFFLDILSVPLFGQFPIPGQASSSSYPARLYINQNMNIWECKTKAALVKHLPFSRVSKSFLVLMQRSGVRFRYINIFSFFQCQFTNINLSVAITVKDCKGLGSWISRNQYLQTSQQAQPHMDLIESFCEAGNAIFATKTQLSKNRIANGVVLKRYLRIIQGVFFNCPP